MKFSHLLLCALPLVSGGVAAHGGETHAAKAAVDYARAEEKAFGRAVDPQTARRTLTVEMSDAMRFTPAEITVRRGDTVRFVIHNRGRSLHEMVLGTEAELREHAALMRKFPGMEHDEPHMAHVAPGQTGEIGWQFTRPGVFHYGCLLPGHFEAGMVGRIIVK